MGFLATALAVTALAWVGIVALAWSLQRHLIYLPSPGPVPAAAACLPGAREITFDTDDGLSLHGWFVPAPGEAARHAVLVLNGNAGDRSLRAPLARRLAGEGFAVLLIDYRGYADNPGRPDERGLTRDALAARRWLVEHAGIPGDRLVYFGESLGAAVALELALKHRPAALVLRSPFTSLADVGKLHYPFLPVRALIRDRYPNLARIPHLTCPVLVLAGERDAIVPASMSRRLWEAAPEPKRLVVLEGADHNDEDLLWGDRMIAEIRAFVARPPVPG